MPGTRSYFMALALTLERNNALLVENKQKRTVNSMGFNLIFVRQELNFDLETDASNRSDNFLFVSLRSMVPLFSISLILFLQIFLCYLLSTFMMSHVFLRIMSKMFLQTSDSDLKYRLFANSDICTLNGQKQKYYSLVRSLQRFIINLSMLVSKS